MAKIKSERKIIVQLIESDELHNYRLIAEAVAKKIKERGFENASL